MYIFHVLKGILNLEIQFFIVNKIINSSLWVMKLLLIKNICATKVIDDDSFRSFQNFLVDSRWFWVTLLILPDPNDSTPTESAISPLDFATFQSFAFFLFFRDLDIILF